MMAAKFDNVGDVTPLNDTWNIKVRIIRLWTTPGYNSSQDVNTIEMVLQDEKDGRIHATVKRAFVNRFKSVLKEGECYVMCQFGVGQNGGSYKTVSHPFKINFLYSTSITLCKDVPSISNFGFVFVPFRDILENVADENIFVDVIGRFSGITDERAADGQKSKMIVITLLDLENNKLTCTLWGQYADQVEQYFATSIERPVIMVIQFCKIKDYKGNKGVRSISNSLYASRLMINADLSEVVNFKLRVPKGDGEESLIIRQVSSQSTVSLKDDFLYLTERKTVGEIRDSLNVCLCVTLATILNIETNNGWSYDGCKICSKKVIPDWNGFFCEKCDRIVTDIVPRYRIQVRVVDDTGSASFMLWDREATQFLKTSARELRERVLLAADNKCVPEQLNEFLGKRFLFKIQINSTNINQPKTTYQVMKLGFDENLIEEYLQITSDADQFNKKLANFNDVEDPGHKLHETDHDSISANGDNELGITGVEQLTPSKHVISENLIDECFEGDSMTAQMSSNQLKKKMKIEKD